MAWITYNDKVLNLRGQYYTGGKGIVVDESNRKIIKDETVLFERSNWDEDVVTSENVSNFEYLLITLEQGRNNDPAKRSKYEVLIRPDGMKYSYGTYGGIGDQGWSHWVSVYLQATGTTVNGSVPCDWLAWLDPREIMCQDGSYGTVGITKVIGINRIG